MHTKVADISENLYNLEPEKCEGWEWIEFAALQQMYRENPHLLFDPLARFIEEGTKHSFGDIVSRI